MVDVFSYAQVTAAGVQLYGCFKYWPYCESGKTKFGLCAMAFSGGKAGQLIGVREVETIFFMGPIPGAGKHCAIRDVPPATIDSNNNPNAPAPSLANRAVTEFTSSQYGLTIPVVFGQDKLGGNVFWYDGFTRDYTTDVNTGDIVYYVKTSFAIGFCEGEIEEVTRVWFGDNVLIDNTANVNGSGIIQPEADGEILTVNIDLFDADSPLGTVQGVTTTPRLRVFNGSERMLPLGIMVDSEGYDNTPAYRGMCFLLFENLLVAEGTIPNIFIEVISGADATMPRAYFDLADSTLFDNRQGDNLIFMPQFDRILVDGVDDAGSRLGLMLLNAGDMSLDAEYYIPDENGVFDDSYATDQAAHIVTETGKIYQNYGVGNPAKQSVFDFQNGAKLFQSEETSGSINAHGTKGFATMRSTGIASTRMQNINTGEFTDYIMGIGAVNGSVGLAAIDKNGQLIMIGSSQNSLGAGSADRFQASAFTVTNDVRANNPTFVSTASTEPSAVIIVHQNVNEVDELKVKLYNFRVDTVNLVFQTFPNDLTPISFQNFQGVGVVHNVPWTFVWERTGKLILCVEGEAGTWFASYNPFDGTLDWVTHTADDYKGGDVTNRVGFTRVVDSVVIPMANQQLLRLNLIDGALTIVSDNYVTDQTLPVMSSASSYSYDGASDSIFYMSATDTQAYVRVYVGRATSSGVAVGQIVKTLLNRVGIYKDQINVSDVELLSIKGYTIPAVKSMRSIFGELASVVKFDLFESDGAISYLSRGDTSVLTLTHEDLQVVDQKGWVDELQEPDFAGARKINLSYRDVDRDYTTNIQSIHLPKYDRTDFDEEAAISVVSPVVLTATEAKVLAEILLYSKIVYTSTYEVMTNIKNVKIDPGDVITVERSDTESFIGRVRETTMGADRNVKLKLIKEDPTIYNDTVTLFGSTGRFVRSIIGAYETLVDIQWLNIPFFSPEQGKLFDQQFVFFATLIPYFEGGSVPFRIMQFTPEDPTKGYAVEAPTTLPTWGTALTNVLDTRAQFSTDYDSTLVIDIRNSGAITPTSAASHAAVVGNPNINLIYINGELLQFVNALDNLDGTYDLTTFLRGKFGTDSQCVGHTVGERVIFLADHTGDFDETSQLTFEAHTDPHLVDPTTHPQNAIHRVSLTGDSDNPFQEPFRKGLDPVGLYPWPVANLTIVYDGGGDADASWNYRDRWGIGEWEDDGDESTEIINRELTDTVLLPSYTVWWTDDPDNFFQEDITTYFKTEIVTTEAATYTAAEQTTDSFDKTASKLYCIVQMNGTFVIKTSLSQATITNIGVQS